MSLKLVAQDAQEVNLRRVLTDEDLAALRKRNEERAAEARAKLGRNWSCHPANRIQKKGSSTTLDPFKRKIPGGF
jgi:hypothetical protein